LILNHPKNNLGIIEQLRKENPQAQFGVTKFADLSPKEFSQFFHPLPEKHKECEEIFKIPQVFLPSAFDWTDKGVVTPVTDQGGSQCGVYLYSLVETIESLYAISSGSLETFGTQQLPTCYTGCADGSVVMAWEYLVQYGFVTNFNGTSCPSPGNQRGKISFSKYVLVTTNNDETTMQNYIYTVSPVSACVDATSWQFYTGGIITSCSFSSLNHCVQVTGWLNQGGTVWNVRNSWGSDWGNNGYIWLAYGSNLCGIASMVTNGVIAKS